MPPYPHPPPLEVWWRICLVIVAHLVPFAFTSVGHSYLFFSCGKHGNSTSWGPHGVPFPTGFQNVHSVKEPAFPLKSQCPHFPVPTSSSMLLSRAPFFAATGPLWPAGEGEGTSSFGPFAFWFVCSSPGQFFLLAVVARSPVMPSQGHFN